MTLEHYLMELDELIKKYKKYSEVRNFQKRLESAMELMRISHDIKVRNFTESVRGLFNDLLYDKTLSTNDKNHITSKYLPLVSTYMNCIDALSVEYSNCYAQLTQEIELADEFSESGHLEDCETLISYIQENALNKLLKNQYVIRELSIIDIILVDIDACNITIIFAINKFAPRQKRELLNSKQERYIFLDN